MGGFSFSDIAIRKGPGLPRQTDELAAVGLKGQLNRGAFTEELGVETYQRNHTERCRRPGEGLMPMIDIPPPTIVNLPAASATA